MPVALVVAALLLLPPAPDLALSSDWVAERPPPYPNLVASYRHRRGAVLTVGVQFLGEGEDGESFASGNAAAMQRMGFEVHRQHDTLDASRRGEPIALRQVYVVRGTVGWVVTLSGEPNVVRALARDLAAIARQLAPAPAAAN